MTAAGDFATGAANRAADAGPDGGSGTRPLALVEALDRDGHVRQAWRIDRWPATIGRALDNDVVLTDPHVAAHHASIGVDAANDADPAPRLVVTAVETKNGIAIGRQRLASGQSAALASGDAGEARDPELSIGRTLLRVRLPGRPLAAEQPLAAVLSREQRWLPTAALALAVVVVVLFTTWLSTDPDNLNRAIGGALLTTVTGAIVWCGLWALLSKLLTRRSHFGWHLRVFVVASLATVALGALPPLLAFAFSWPWLTDFSFIAVYAAIATAIYFHLLAVEPARERLMRGVVVAGFLSAVALSLWFNVQRTGRMGEELYMNHLFPPAARVARPVSVDRFVDGLAPVQATLDKKAREPVRGDGDTRESDDEE